MSYMTRTHGQYAILSLAWFTEPLPDNNTQMYMYKCTNKNFISEPLFATQQFP